MRHEHQAEQIRGLASLGWRAARRARIALIALLAWPATCAVAGALYIWVDAEGNKHVSDQPPIGESYNTKLDTTRKMTGTAPGARLFAPASAASAASAPASGAATPRH
ncbi:DUF4124 domain-containing protein [Aquabacterium sp.]|uniref:DUF4124 domain-containing protein n=1 Tax=Aquabacterium sp. TaxID=1872578 RepID=UPI0035B002F7